MIKKESKEEAQIRKLKEREQQIKNKIKDKKQRLKAEEKKREDKRKILVGAAILEKVRKKEWPEDKFKNLMSEFLTRNSDRELFGLLPIKDEQPESEKTSENPPA